MQIDNISETVTLSKEEYDSFMEDVRMLNVLYDCGVDNWEGYDEAVTFYRENYACTNR